MAKSITPPTRGCSTCGTSSKSTANEYWINKTNNHWMIGDRDTGVNASGNPGISPHIGNNGNWWIGNVDTGVPANGTVEESGPQSATDLF